MTYPDSGSPADPRDELDAIRRRLAEITPAGPRGAGNGLLVATGLAIAGSLVALLVAIAVASTLEGGGGQAAVLVVGLCVVVGFAVLGFSVFRRWQVRSNAVRRERLELLARQEDLVAGLGAPRRPGQPAYQPAPWPNRNDRFRMVVGTILAVLVLTAVLATILVRAG